MVNAMDWLYSQEKYNTREKREGVRKLEIGHKDLEGHLDLREFVNLTYLDCSRNKLTSLDVSQNINLTELTCPNNKMGGDLTPFSKFINLKTLQLGNIGGGTGNYFHGSLEPLKNLTKLTYLCIEGTDVDSGLEYLPMSLALATKGKPRSVNFALDCTAGKGKVIAIQNELRLYNYDLEAWQLAHPEKMVKVLQEKDLEREQWLKSLTDKITNTQAELSTAKQNEADKLSKIARLETKISELTQAKTQISRQTQTEFSTQDKGTQTDLTSSQLTQLEQDSQTFLKLLHATEQELTNTKQQLTQIQEKLTNQSQQIVHQDQTITHLEQQKTQTNQTITNLQGQMEVKKTELQQAKDTSNQLSSELETVQEKNKSYLENIKSKEEIINDNNQQIKQLKSQLQTSQTELTTQSTINQDLTNAIKQLQSKIKLLEQQKENYQTKYDKSIEFIKEIREDIIKM